MPDISKSKGNQTVIIMKFGQLIRYNVKNHAECFQYVLVFIDFSMLAHTTKINLIKL